MLGDFTMESDSLLTLACVVSVISGLFDSTVHATSPGQHGDQQGKGPLRYSREFLLSLQNSDSPIPTLDFPSEMKKYDDSVKVRKRKEENKNNCCALPVPSRL